MMMILSTEDVASLTGPTRAELLAKFNEGRQIGAPVHQAPPQQLGPEYQGIDLEDVADLTFKQIQTWMEGVSDRTKLGLRVLAEQGPVVPAQAFKKAGIDNLSHFQSRTTIRTRTVTGDKEAFLVGWDDWSEAEDDQGKYAVTPITYQSLRRYFQLD